MVRSRATPYVPGQTCLNRVKRNGGGVLDCLARMGMLMSRLVSSRPRLRRCGPSLGHILPDSEILDLDIIYRIHLDTVLRGIALTLGIFGSGVRIPFSVLNEMSATS
jgi:hypothetical protein